MMRWPRRHKIASLLFATCSALANVGWASGAEQQRFDCGGMVEGQALSLWDSNVRAYLERSVQERLLEKGDVYVLYDLQTYTHNLLAMARRCGRRDVILDIERIVRRSFDALQRPGLLSADRRWICRGGKTCTYRNGLLGSEVMLCSVQFLGLAASVAHALVQDAAELDTEQRAFVREVSDLIEEHLQRWGDAKAINAINALVNVSPDDEWGSPAKVLFTDRSLWMIAIYAEWAGLLRSPAAQLNDARDRISGAPQFGRHLDALLRLFNARTFVDDISGPGKISAPLADIDSGFWSRFSDNRYAGYEGEQKPVVCQLTSTVTGAGSEETLRARVTGPKLIVAASPATLSADVGWDISHARRLVHALDALQGNHDAMVQVFSLNPGSLPRNDLVDAFAGSILARVWNGDKQKPLFRNYLNGANGWYRVGYSPAGGCNEGKPPYGLTDSFLTGGYASWGAYRPLISDLAHQLYDLTESRASNDRAFVGRYYPQFGNAASAQNRALSRIMFLPSLVGIGKP